MRYITGGGFTQPPKRTDLQVVRAEYDTAPQAHHVHLQLPYSGTWSTTGVPSVAASV